GCRLHAADNLPEAFGYSVRWADSAGVLSGLISGTLPATQVLPILSQTVSGPALAGPGDLVSFNVSISNSGHSPASDAIVSETLPAGTVPVSVGAVPAGGSTSTIASFPLAALATRQIGEIAAAYVARLAQTDGVVI